MSDRSDELRLQPGEIVEVRHVDEILGTLAPDGTLDGLPFMPEMLPFCGRRFRVFRRAHKTCDTISWSGLRGMDRTVHLEDLRCDGSAHGGCQAGCLLFWKEAWLRRVDDDAPATQGPDGDHPTHAVPQRVLEFCQVVSSEGDTRFRCQATELLKATYALPALQPSQYVCDVRSNGTTWTGAVVGVGLSLINRGLRILRQPTIPRVVGSLLRTPHVELGLEVGDWIEVKSHAEILATLDRRGKNRGLSFDSEMVPYCGGRFRVLRRVETIVDEATGKLRTLPGVCIVLEGVVCRGVYHRSCPRSIYPYWREIWLRRVEPAD
jgi:hypothetical protein